MTWFVAFLQPNREALAASHLDARGYGTFYPTFRDWRAFNGRHFALRPLFPRYLFLEPVRVLGLYQAATCPGVVRLLCRTGREPSPVPQDVVDTLRDGAASGMFDVLAPNALPLAIGMSVRVTGGCFGGLIGSISGRPAEERVEVLLQILGAARPVLVPRGQLEPTSPDENDSHLGAQGVRRSAT